MHREYVFRQTEVGLTDAAYLLALVLWDEAAEESVRVQEALAAAVANQVRQWRQQAVAEGRLQPDIDLSSSARARLFVSCLNLHGRRNITPPPSGDAVFAMCRRIAGRAVTGALKDSTGGAVRFHRLGATPSWVNQFEPGPLIGSHLFYHDRGAGTFAARHGRCVA